MELYRITDVNPNDEVGGGGCVCSDSKVEGCDPPYAVFYATETDSVLSPHVVVCQRCLESASDACAVSDADVVPVEAEAVEEDVSTEESEAPSV